jgi:thymidylate synthase (FAD)
MQASDITIFKAPRVWLVADQRFHLPEPFKGWETDAPSDGETLAEFAGRLCYLSFSTAENAVNISGGHGVIKGRPGGNSAYLDNILQVKHGSVLEHAVWSLLFEGVSRTLTHELVRHRAGFGFSQLSQRYVDESNIGFVLPPEIDEGTEEYEIWYEHCLRSGEDYRKLLRRLEQKISQDEGTMKKKRARQAARSVLPNCAETKILVTGNGRAWRHFCEMRGSPSADMEIRALAVEAFKVLEDQAPNLFAGVDIGMNDDGTDVLHFEYSKV